MKNLIYLFLLVVIAISFFVVVLNEPSKEDYLTVEVMAGDTLWGYAKEYQELHKMDARSFVDWVERENNIFYGEIYPGDVIRLPIEKAAVKNNLMLAANFEK